MKKTIASIIILQASVCVAGSGVGGGTPPAREQLEQLLLMSRPGVAGLFDAGNGDIGLLMRTELQPQMLVTGSEIGGGTPLALTLSESDFALLRNRTKPLDAVTMEGGNASYNVIAGDMQDSVTLHDRRDVARAAIKK